MFRILPEFYDNKLHIPWYTLAVFYSVEVCLVLCMYGTTTVNTMSGIGAIPEEYLMPVVATIVVAAFIMYVVFYLMSYQDKKADVLAKKAEALKAGEEVDSVAIASIENFHTVYIVAMALGIIITSAISFALMSIVLNDYVVYDTVVKTCAYAAIATVVVYVLFDTFVGRRIADRTFKSKVVNPLVQGIIAQFEAPVEGEAEAAPADEIDPNVKLIAELLANLNKAKKE